MLLLLLRLPLAKTVPAGMRGPPVPGRPRCTERHPRAGTPTCPPVHPRTPVPPARAAVTVTRWRRPRGEEPPSLRSPPSPNFPLAAGRRRCLLGTWHRHPGAESCQHPTGWVTPPPPPAGAGDPLPSPPFTVADSSGAGGFRHGRGRTGQSGERQRGEAEPAPMCRRSRRGDEAAMTAGEGALRPWKPDPGQAEGGRPPPGPSLPLTLTVLAWLGTGTTMAGLNKWIFATHGFRYPLLLSSLHMLSGVAVGYPLGWARGPPSPPPPSPRPRARIYLLSLTFCTSVALGNLGLSYVQLDVAQAVATTTPLVTLLLSGLLGGRRHHPLQYAAMGPVCAGAACSIAGGLRIYQPGCGFLLAATVLRALKSVQQSKCRPSPSCTTDPRSPPGTVPRGAGVTPVPPRRWRRSLPTPAPVPLLCHSSPRGILAPGATPAPVPTPRHPGPGATCCPSWPR